MSNKFLNLLLHFTRYCTDSVRVRWVKLQSFMSSFIFMLHAKNYYHGAIRKINVASFFGTQCMFTRLPTYLARQKANINKTSKFQLPSCFSSVRRSKLSSAVYHGTKLLCLPWSLRPTKPSLSCLPSAAEAHAQSDVSDIQQLTILFNHQ